jgi:hypothetical protein
MGPQVRRSQPDALAPAIADGSAARGRHPYSLAFMPWLTELAPSTSYVLVVRDGRDVAMPTNLAADKMLELARPLLPVGRVGTPEGHGLSGRPPKDARPVLQGPLFCYPGAPRHELVLRIWARFNLQVEAMAAGSTLTVFRTDCHVADERTGSGGGAAFASSASFRGAHRRAYTCGPAATSLETVLERGGGGRGAALARALRACEPNTLERVAEQARSSSLGSSNVKSAAARARGAGQFQAMSKWRTSGLNFSAAMTDPVVVQALLRYGYEIR